MKPSRRWDTFPRVETQGGGRRRIAGTQAVEQALARGEPLRLIVVDGAEEAAGRALAGPARAAGVRVQSVGSRHFDRLRPPGAPGGALALAGDAPAAGPGEVMLREGAAWLLTGVEYPGNAGFAIRTAEVSGAAGIFLDAPFDHAKRREALRASMRADRFLPVLWGATHEVLDAAKESGRRVVAVEDVGTRAPWEVDLRGPVLFVVGGESGGVPASALERCEAVVRIPMAGIIRSYNLQAAVAIVAAERMRQVGRE